MANRFVDVLYRLKDLFTGPAGKVSAAYRELGKEADRTAGKVEASHSRMANIGGRFEKLAGGITRMRAGIAGLVATLAGSAIVRELGAVADQADRIGKAADTLDTTAEAVSRLAYAAELSSVPFEALNTALNSMRRRIGDAQAGAAEMQKVFQRLGVDLTELSELDTEEQFLSLGDALNAVSSETERASLAAKVFGEGARDLARVTEQGSVAIRRMGEEAARTGRIVDDELAAAAARYNDNAARLGGQVDRLKFQLIGPVIKQAAEEMEQLGLVTDTSAEGIQRQIGRLEAMRQRIEDLPRIIRSFRIDKIREIDTEIFRLQAVLRQLAEAEAEAAEKTAALTKRQEEAAAAAARQRDETAALEQRVKARRDALAEETADLKAARAEQARIEQQYTDLLADVSATDKRVSGNDVSLLAVQARKALAEGDTAAAQEIADRGAAALKKLKDQGDEAGFVLRFLAKQLQAVATEAAGQRTRVELIDVQREEAAIAAVEARLQAIAQKGLTVPVTLVPAGGGSFADVMSAEVARRGGK